MAYACQGGAPCCNQASCCAQGTCKIFSLSLFFLIAGAKNRIEILSWTLTKYKKNLPQVGPAPVVVETRRAVKGLVDEQSAKHDKTQQSSKDLCMCRLYISNLHLRFVHFMRKQNLKNTNSTGYFFVLLVSDFNPSFSCEHWVKESTSCCRVDSRWTNVYVTEMFFYYYDLLTSSRHFLPLQCFRCDVQFLTSNQHDGKAGLCLIQFNLGQKTRG